MYRQVHMGRTSESFADGVAAVLRSVPAFKRISVEVIRESKGNKDLWFSVDDEVAAAAFAKAHGFLLGTVKKACEIMKEGKYGEPSRWAFINALTEASQSLSIDARSDVEQAAGKLLLEKERNSVA
jgi:hypothetical protein